MGKQRQPVARLRYEGVVNIGVAIVGAVITYVAFGEWLPGWLGGLLIGLFGGRALASRRPDLADPTPAPKPQTWQQVVVGALLVATTVALLVSLTN